MKMNVYLSEYIGLVISFILIVIVSLTTILYLFNKKKLNAIESEFNSVKNMMKSINLEKGLEENLNRLLEMFAYLIKAPTYTFYVLDKKNRNYLLKAVRYQSEDFGNVRPSYSGLASFKSGMYMPSLSIPASKQVYELKKVMEGETPLFYLPVGEKGIIIIGPLENMKKGERRVLSVLSEQMSYLLENLITTEDIRSQAEVVVASGKALQRISNISMDWKTMMEMMIKLCAQSIDASGGFFIQKHDGIFEVTLHVGLESGILTELNGDSETLKELYSYVENEQYYFLKQTDEEYYRLPPYFAAAGMEEITVMKLDISNDGFFVLWFDEGNKHHEDDKMLLRSMIDQIQSVIGYQSALNQFSSAYLDILKLLSRLLDNLSPYTVGYSEMMSRYSVSIARQLKLDEDLIQDIALAAYLSNIGVLGLASTLFDKDGKYTDEEYELMKLHSEVGASIVSVATGNERVASFILHHHERIDGNGYPSGLKEDEIPIGSKIIAVVQTFLAKINGRKYRDPLDFSEAIKMLQSCAGSQLDEHIVQVFVEWYTKKRANPHVKNRPMGKCWEILCVPSSICEKCPVYQQKDVPCWEVANNLCQAHGKSCETCIVRTEYTSRDEIKI